MEWIKFVSLNNLPDSWNFNPQHCINTDIFYIRDSWDKITNVKKVYLPKKKETKKKIKGLTYFISLQRFYISKTSLFSKFSYGALRECCKTIYVVLFIFLIFLYIHQTQFTLQILNIGTLTITQIKECLQEEGALRPSFFCQSDPSVN